MKQMLSAQSWKAIAHYGDAATVEFYRRMKERLFSSTRCESCGEVAFPPRSFCPFCHGRTVTWVDLPRRGKLYAFTQQHKSVRFLTPDVLGLVELAGVGRILSRIDAPMESLAIGDELEVDFLELASGFWVHQFRLAANRLKERSP